MQFPLLSLIIFIPLVAGLTFCCLPAERREWIRRIALGGGQPGPCCYPLMLYSSYNTAAGRLPVHRSTCPGCRRWGSPTTWAWMGSALPLVLLAGVVVFCGVLISWNVEDRPREFFAFLLFLATSVFGVFCFARPVPAVLLLRAGRLPQVPDDRRCGARPRRANTAA